MPEDELHLIQLARQGDAEACTALYERYYDVIYRYCYYHTCDMETAQDVTADVFTRMVENLGNLDMRDRPLLAWLYTVARNRITDGYRKTGHLAQLPLDDMLVDGEQSTDGSVEQVLLADSLRAGLAELTEEQRQVIVLRFVQDHDVPETAELMGKTEGAIKALQHRALAALRRVLREAP